MSSARGNGSTVATNAVLERKGASVALFVTQGTRDVLLLQRHTRNSIYDVHYRKPSPIVGRNAVFEVEERIAADGDVVEPLDVERAADMVDRAIANVLDAGLRTGDIMQDGKKQVGTKEMGAAIKAEMDKLAA